MYLFLLPLLLSTGAILQHYNNIQHAYVSFVHGRSNRPLPTAKVPQSLQDFYSLAYNESYTLKITAPFLTAFLDEQAQNNPPAELRLLHGMSSSPAQLVLPAKFRDMKTKLAAAIAQKQKLSHQYLRQAEHHFFNRDDVFTRLAQDTHLLQQLSPSVIKYYQKKDLAGLIAYMQRSGRSEALDAVLHLLISHLNMTSAGAPVIQQQMPALEKLYKGYAGGDNARTIMKNVTEKIQDQHLRLLCCFRDNLTQLLSIQQLLRLEYLLRRPVSCVYAPRTYEKLGQAAQKLQELDIHNYYADYTNTITRMIDIYRLNYVINNIRSLRRQDPGYSNNILVQLLRDIPSITILAINEDDGKTTLLNRQNIDIFLKANA